MREAIDAWFEWIFQTDLVSDEERQIMMQIRPVLLNQVTAFLEFAVPGIEQLEPLSRTTFTERLVQSLTVRGGSEEVSDIPFPSVADSRGWRVHQLAEGLSWEVTPIRGVLACYWMGLDRTPRVKEIIAREQEARKKWDNYICNNDTIRRDILLNFKRSFAFSTTFKHV